MAKRSLFDSEVLWCGRLISAHGVRHDHSRLDALTSLPVPATQLASSDYARAIAPLHAKLETDKKRIGNCNKYARVVATHWTESVRAAYNAVVSLIKDSALMVHPDPDADLWMFNDASLAGYSIVITQVKRLLPGIAVDKQHHKLIICKGGLFKHSQLNWTVVEREAFPIVKACDDLEYLLLRARGFRLYCDHANLVYIFAPHVELKKTRV
ncbi:Hypothetical protein PHPALM_17040 [Phytophthora palmivora]|uniref:Reverse transcriptase RNase H-like domain-containing protein n=1 Tax=Phytophthora palmivora TaxID=4796 RepID=A0A2P4XN94_9STRA|nr:Hypothetical protein PHPALM_17040 [Phytophthora palmivora]